MALQKTGIVEPLIDADVVPSVGVDISNLPIAKKQTLQMKEVGGAMMPLWPMYLNNSAGLIYMVDMSDSIQLGASAAHFHHLCGLPTVKGKPILLVLNKMDAPCLLHRGELESAFDMDAVVEELGDSLTVLEASALSGLNVKAIMDWTKSIYGII